MEGQDLRQTLVTIGISIVLADLMLWIWGGDFYQILTPDWLVRPGHDLLRQRGQELGRAGLPDLPVRAPR